MPQTLGSRGASGFDPSIDPSHAHHKPTEPGNFKPDRRGIGIRIVLTMLLVGIIIVCVASILRPNQANTDQQHKLIPVTFGLDQRIADLEKQLQQMQKHGLDTKTVEIELNKLKAQRAFLLKEIDQGGTPVQRQRTKPVPIVFALAALFTLVFLWRDRIFRMSDDRTGTKRIKGFVRSKEQRTEVIPGVNKQTTIQVFTFKVEIQENDVSVFVPVEMKGEIFHGVLRDGDEVEIMGPWRPGLTLQPEEILNLNTGGKFGPLQSSLHGVWLVIAILFPILAVLVFIFVIRGKILP